MDAMMEGSGFARVVSDSGPSESELATPCGSRWPRLSRFSADGANGDSSPLKITASSTIGKENGAKNSHVTSGVSSSPIVRTAYHSFSSGSDQPNRSKPGKDSKSSPSRDNDLNGDAKKLIANIQKSRNDHMRSSDSSRGKYSRERAAEVEGDGFPPRAPFTGNNVPSSGDSRWNRVSSRNATADGKVWDSESERSRRKDYESVSLKAPQSTDTVNHPLRGIRRPSSSSDPRGGRQHTETPEQYSQDRPAKGVLPFLNQGKVGEYTLHTSTPISMRSDGSHSPIKSPGRSLSGSRPDSGGSNCGDEASYIHPEGCLCITCYQKCSSEADESEEEEIIYEEEEAESELEEYDTSSGVVYQKKNGECKLDKSPEKSGKQPKTITLVESLFPHRPPTVYFDYPGFVGSSRKCLTPTFTVPAKDFELAFKISVVHEYNAVRNAWQRAGFKKTTGKNWNALWSCHLKEEELARLNPFQKVNHFPGTWAIGRKDRLARSMAKKYRDFGEEYNVIPRTYLLPADRGSLKRDLTKNPRCMWILKPVASSCGRGIRLVSGHIINNKSRRPTRLKKSGSSGTLGNGLPSKSKKYIAQEYVRHPHLIDGRKYDLRLYVLVTSFDPLRIYLYKDGLVRFCTETYSTSCKNGSVANRYAHLTNYSVNKRSSVYDKNQSPQADGQGSKWSLQALLRYFKAIDINSDAVMSDIKDVVIKTLISCEAEVGSAYGRSFCNRNAELGTGTPVFEVFGFDILLDHHLKPWLMEVNVSPSLSSSSPLDKKIKSMLMSDAFHLVGFVPYDSTIWSAELDKIRSARLIRKKSQGLTCEAVAEAAPSVLSGKKYLNSALQIANNAGRRRLNVSEIESGLCKFEDIPMSDLSLIFDLEDEWSRKGDFDPIFPTKKAWKNYKKYFESKRKGNVLMDVWLNKWRSKVMNHPETRSYLFNCSDATVAARLPEEFSRRETSDVSTHRSMNSDESGYSHCGAARSSSIPKKPLSKVEQVYGRRSAERRKQRQEKEEKGPYRSGQKQYESRRSQEEGIWTTLQPHDMESRIPGSFPRHEERQNSPFSLQSAFRLLDVSERESLEDNLRLRQHFRGKNIRGHQRPASASAESSKGSEKYCWYQCN